MSGAPLGIIAYVFAQMAIILLTIIETSTEQHSEVE